MAYNDNELSIAKGKPRELYRFVGTYKTYRYTTNTAPVRWQAPDELQSYTYLPITMKRSEVTAGTPDDDNLDLTVNLPVTAEIVTAYGFNVAPPDLNLTIWRYHTLDSVVPYWRGRINNISVDEGVAAFNSPSEIGRAMNADFPNVYYQSPCNHVLYDERCKVAYADWSVVAKVLAVADKAITLSTIGKFDGKLIGGEVVLPSGERRMISAQDGTVVTINFPFSAVNVGTSVTIAVGCDYAWSGDCKTKFANQINFGGFPFVAEDNVFETGAEPGFTLPDMTCDPECFAQAFATFEIWITSSAEPTVKFFNLNFPQFNPNGAGGLNIKELGSFSPSRTIKENFNANNPALQGQDLIDITFEGAPRTYHMIAKFLAPVPVGSWNFGAQFDFGRNTHVKATFKRGSNPATTVAEFDDVYQAGGFINVPFVG